MNEPSGVTAVERFLRRASKDFGARLEAAMRHASQKSVPAHWEDAVKHLLKEATVDEILALIRQLLESEQKVGHKDARAMILQQLASILIDMAGENPQMITFELSRGWSPRAASTQNDQWEHEREFLRQVPGAALEELGERTRNVLHFVYDEVTPRGTDGEFVMRSSDRGRLSSTFERLLWLAYLSNDFTTADVPDWLGRPVAPGTEKTPGGSYMRPEVRERLLREIMAGMPELLQPPVLNSEELAALKADYAFLEVEPDPGMTLERKNAAQRAAFLKLLWAHRERRLAASAAGQDEHS